MNRITTQGIVLTRTDFGEADRIVTFLTLEHGKLRGLVRGVRKTKSKLAGGIELFSVSDITYLAGRGEVSTIISTRLVRHYGQIVKDLDRTNLGYDLIKKLNRATEDNPEPAYFELLDQALAALDNQVISLDLIQVWFNAQLLKLAGHTPNLISDQDGRKLSASKNYDFNFDAMHFQTSDAGQAAFGADQIKFLRLIFSNNSIFTLQKVQGASQLSGALKPLVQTMLQAYIRV